MKFKNRPNKLHKCNDKQVWESRSVAVNGVILAINKHDEQIYVLCSKRGPNAADYNGLMNVIAGYLDWDETSTEALIRETWEETGINIPELLTNYKVINNNLIQPWYVKTDPSSNRQNVSLRYGLVIEFDRKLPEPNTLHNEVEGEVEHPVWLPIEEIDNYEWAFDHDKVINDYMIFTYELH